MKKINIPSFILLFSCWSIVSCKNSINASQQIDPTPSGNSGEVMIYENNGTAASSSISRPLRTPGRGSIQHSDPLKVFAGWCSALPCASTDDLSYYVGGEFPSSGAVNLYALWVDRSDNWTSLASGELVVPNGVTSIADEAFFDSIAGVGRPLTSVVLSDSVQTVGAYSFALNNLAKVVIPNSVTSIGEVAFAGNQITSVIIPDTVTSIAYGAFSLNGLTSVSIPPLTYITGFNSNLITSITIPNTATTIGVEAFSGNRLTSVTIPSSGNIDYFILTNSKDWRLYKVAKSRNKSDAQLIWDVNLNNGNDIESLVDEMYVLSKHAYIDGKWDYVSDHSKATDAGDILSIIYSDKFVKSICRSLRDIHDVKVVEELVKEILVEKIFKDSAMLNKNLLKKLNTVEVKVPENKKDLILEVVEEEVCIEAEVKIA